jgi:glycosyltransferase involved in cell wall biosynthesis
MEPTDRQSTRRDPHRVAIFFWEGYVGVAPSIINALTMLASAGYGVDLITRSTREALYAQAPSFPTNVHIYSMQTTSEQKSSSTSTPPGVSVTEADTSIMARLKACLPSWIKRPLRNAIDRFRILAELRHFLIFGMGHLRGKSHVCIIGVDMFGVIPAAIAAVAKRLPLVYWSLELKFLREFSQQPMRTLKRLERLCARRAMVSLVQDQYRAESLICENGIRPHRVILVPNGPLGSPPGIRSDYLQRKFGLGDRTILLHIGEISEQVLSFELAQEAASWPDNWVLVLHERQKRHESGPYLKKIARAANGKAVLSLNPVDYRDLDRVVCSGHIGLVLYRAELGPNFAQIVGASGKLGHYLRCGLPVICLALPGFRNLMDQYRCGECIEALAEIPGAIRKILNNYHEYSRNAVRCYEESFEFETRFKPVIARIQELLPNAVSPS